MAARLLRLKLIGLQNPNLQADLLAAGSVCADHIGASSLRFSRA